MYNYNLIKDKIKTNKQKVPNLLSFQLFYLNGKEE